VDGLLVESDKLCGLYDQQSFFWPAEETLVEGKFYLLYIDVWEISLEVSDHQQLPEVSDEITRARRWDGAEFEIDGKWQPLADGVSVQFKVDDKLNYRTGDYWMIPVRIATGNVDIEEAFLPPFGIDHHYAPLAIVKLSSDSTQFFYKDLRKVFDRLARDS